VSAVQGLRQRLRLRLRHPSTHTQQTTQRHSHHVIQLSCTSTPTLEQLPLSTLAMLKRRRVATGVAASAASPPNSAQHADVSSESENEHEQTAHVTSSVTVHSDGVKRAPASKKAKKQAASDVNGVSPSADPSGSGQRLVQCSCVWRDAVSCCC
jgi:hypothetical protein